MTCQPASPVLNGQAADAISVPPAPSRNRLLSALSEEDFERLKPHLEPVTLKRGQVLHKPRWPIEHVYFIEDGLVSVVAEVPRDKPVEVWLLGREGLAGMPVLLGGRVSTHRRYVQVPGKALRIASDKLQDAFDQSRSLRQVLLRYVYAILKQTSLVGACNARHSLQQRLARWLLLSRDLLETQDLPITHDTLALLLAVRRAGVTEALAGFEHKGLVEHHRGHVVIRDAEGLRRVACECYTALHAIYDRLLASNGSAAAENDGGR